MFPCKPWPTLNVYFFYLQLLLHGVNFVFPGFQYMWLAEETKKNLPLELDFIHEGRNCERVERLFKHVKFLKVSFSYIFTLLTKF